MDDTTCVSRIRDHPQSKQAAPLYSLYLDMYFTSILHTPLPIRLTHGHHGALAALPLLAAKEMASRLPNPRPSWPTSKVTLFKVPVQARRGSFIDFVNDLSVDHNSFAPSPLPIPPRAQTLPRLPPKILKTAFRPLSRRFWFQVKASSSSIFIHPVSHPINLYPNRLYQAHIYTPTSHLYFSLHNQRSNIIHIQVTIDNHFPRPQPSNQYSSWPSRNINLLSTTAAPSVARQLTLVHTTTAPWAPSVLAARTETAISC